MTSPLLPPSRTTLPGRPTRRAVASGLAWSVPVVAVGAAAPHAAASCAPFAYTLQWGGSATTSYTRVDSSSASAIVTSPDAGAPPVTVSIAAAGSVPEVQPRFDNLTVVAPPVGGTSQHGLLVRQSELGSGGAPPGTDFDQRVTFAFDQTVTGLTFTVTDVDSNKDGTNFVDEIYLLTDPSGAVLADASYLQGNATSTSPLRPLSDNSPLADETSSRGNATVTYAGAVQSITLVLRNGTDTAFVGEVIQSVFVLEMSFGVVPDTC